VATGAGKSPADVDAALRALERDPVAMENAALAILSCAWQEPGEEEKIRRLVRLQERQRDIQAACHRTLIGTTSMTNAITADCTVTASFMEKIRRWI